jgi:hypothetical protein
MVVGVSSSRTLNACDGKTVTPSRKVVDISLIVSLGVVYRSPKFVLLELPEAFV